MAMYRGRNTPGSWRDAVAGENGKDGKGKGKGKNWYGGKRDYHQPPWNGYENNDQSNTWWQKPSSYRWVKEISLPYDLEGIKDALEQALAKRIQMEDKQFEDILKMLTELQNRQTHLEEMLQSMSNGGQPQSMQQYSYSDGAASGQCQGMGSAAGQSGAAAGGGQQQQYGIIGVQMNGGAMHGQQRMQQISGPHAMNGQQQMQQYTGVMTPDGSESVVTTAAFPQVLFVAPVSSQQMVSGPVQYAAVPQGATMQPMTQQMETSPMAQNNAQNIGDDSQDSPPVVGQDAAQYAATSSRNGGQTVVGSSLQRIEGPRREFANDNFDDEIDDMPGQSPGSVVSPLANGVPEKKEPTWDKVRTWKVVNVEHENDQKLAVLSRPEPFPPDGSRVPPDDIVVGHLENGDIVRQLGHAKKMRGYMVMPIRKASEGEDEDDNEGGEDSVEGWVTRRLADKYAEKFWFEECLSSTRAAERRQRREARTAERREEAEEE